MENNVHPFSVGATGSGLKIKLRHEVVREFAGTAEAATNRRPSFSIGYLFSLLGFQIRDDIFTVLSLLQTAKSHLGSRHGAAWIH